MKMSPALFVLYWVFERRWVAARQLASASVRAMFCMRSVLAGRRPSFLQRGITGVRLRSIQRLAGVIDLFGNHSIPNLWHLLWPAPRGWAVDIRSDRFDVLQSACWRLPSLLAFETSILLGQMARWAAVAMVMPPFPSTRMSIT